MSIKKIIFKNLSTTLTYLAIGGIRFYDDRGVVIPSGSPISQGENSGEFDNFLITGNLTPFSNTYYPTYAFDTNKTQTGATLTGAANFYWLSNTKTNGTLTCTFKTPLKAISSIEFAPRVSTSTDRGVTSNFNIEVYNEADKLIVSYLVHPIVTNNSVQVLITEELNFIEKHFIKSSNKIHNLFENTLMYPNLQEPITQEQFEQFGMDTLEGYENSISKVAYEMDADGVLEDGRVVRKAINKNEFKISKIGISDSGYTDTLIPNMTNFTTPSGAARASSNWSGRYAWKAFNEMNSTPDHGWTPGGPGANWIEYEFAQPVNIQKYGITHSPNTHDLGGMHGAKWKLLGSNDGVNFVDLHIQDIGISAQEWLSYSGIYYEFQNNEKYKIYRIQFTTTGYVYIGYIEMMEVLDLNRSLIKSQNKIQVLVDDVWTDTLLSEPLTKVDFETHGMDDISDIPFEKWDELDEEFEVITWTDEEGGASKWLELQTDPFSPMQRLNQEEEFEVITWTDYKTELPSSRTSTEETVDEGKLFKATLEDFVAITGVEVN